MADSASSGYRDGKRDKGPHKRNRRGDQHYHQKQRKEKVEDPLELTPTLLVFKEYQNELDSKHDKHERLVKLSRDVTIESKRIIFLLHRIDGDSEKILEEAEERLNSVQDNQISKIAHELKGEELHQFLRAFSPGLQEYIEAVSFYLFVKEGRLVSLEEVAARLTFTERSQKRTADKNDTDTAVTLDSNQPATTAAKQTEEHQKEAADTTPAAGTDPSVETDDGRPEPTTMVSLKLPPLEYMLGLADFTGELMRLCINTVGSGDLDRPFRLAAFARHIHKGFQLLGNQAGRELSRKSTTMRQSVRKMEDACYVIRVRGSEIPSHMLKDVAFGSDFHSGGGAEEDYGQG